MLLYFVQGTSANWRKIGEYPMFLWQFGGCTKCRPLSLQTGTQNPLFVQNTKIWVFPRKTRATTQLSNVGLGSRGFWAVMYEQLTILVGSRCSCLVRNPEPLLRASANLTVGSDTGILNQPRQLVRISPLSLCQTLTKRPLPVDRQCSKRSFPDPLPLAGIFETRTTWALQT